MKTINRPAPYCQLHTVPHISEGLVDPGPQTIRKRVKIWLKRNLDARTKRRIKRLSDSLLGRIRSRSGANEMEVKMAASQVKINMDQTAAPASSSRLQPGDRVRVRSRAEIEATLDSWSELKGCGMMPDMWQFCNTHQRVFKVVERFVDERDYRLKKGRGVVLLENLICGGTPDYGRCDRSCFYFWREEWLEKIYENEK